MILCCRTPSYLYEPLLRRAFLSAVTVKLEKSIFYVHKIEYLGYIITESGVKMDPKKISTIAGWLILKNVYKVQFFLGFINFYCRFIKGYSEVAASLTNLTKKDNLWVWNDNTENTFQGFKKRFT